MDYVLYIGIAFAFLGMVFFVEGRWGHDAFIRWGGLAGFSAGLFGFFISDSRAYLRERRFWISTALLFAAHLAAFVILLTHVSEWRLMWFVGMALEYPVFVLVRSRIQYPS